MTGESVTMCDFAGLAHLVEQLICNHQVAGSSPAAGTKYRNGSQKWDPFSICASKTRTFIREGKKPPLATAPASYPFTSGGNPLPGEYKMMLGFVNRSDDTTAWANVSK